MKKIYIGIGIVLGVGAIFVIFFLKSGNQLQPDSSNAQGQPFGSGEGYNQGGFDEGENTGGLGDLFDENGVPIAQVFSLSDAPVAGAVAIMRNGRTFVRYVDRATGHIIEVALPKSGESAPLEKVKIVNNTIPKVYEAIFRQDGEAVVLRTLKKDSDVIESSAITISPATTTPEGGYKVSSALLRGDITGVIAGLGNSILYADKSSRSIVSTTFSANSVSTLYSTPFTDWQLAPAGINVLLYTKPDPSVAGIAYILNPSTKSLNKVLGPMFSLAAVSNTQGNQLFYSYKNSGTQKASVLNLQSGRVVETSPATLAEKCVFSHARSWQVICGVPSEDIYSSEPSSWYRGETSFSDRVWRFDTNNETSELLFDPETLNVEVDIIDPKLSPDESYLIFINKRDLSLWALKLQAQ